MRLIPIGISGLLCCGLAAQDAGRRSGRPVTEDVRRARELAQQLRTSNRTDTAQLTPERYRRLTVEVERLVQEQVERSLEQSDDLTRLRAELASMEILHLDRESSRTPDVIRIEVDGQPVIIVAYVLLRGGDLAPDSKCFLHAYRRDAGTPYRLVARSGDDFDQHGLFISSVQSPRAGEMWLLAHGAKFGVGSGRRVRTRLYRFDGQAFVTLWEPLDHWDATVTTKNGEVSIEHLARLEGRETWERYFRLDRYELTMSGVQLVWSGPARDAIRQ